MEEKQLQKLLELQTQTIMAGVNELHDEAMQEIQKTKLEIFDKIAFEINESEGRLTKKLASKEEVDSIEHRVTKLEEQIA